jgi:hypothetical protein
MAQAGLGELDPENKENHALHRLIVQAKALNQDNGAMSDAVPSGPLEGVLPIGRAVSFGPTFFLTHLAAFVRQQCPDPAEGLPFVHLHLVGGEVLDLCHVIGLTPCWIALAVYEEGAGAPPRTMRTELVPYELMMRISIRVGQAQGARLGFHQESPPAFSKTPEEALQVAATPRFAARCPDVSAGKISSGHREAPRPADPAGARRSPGHRRRSRSVTR